MGKGIDKFMNILSLNSGDDDDYDNDDLFDDEIDLVEPPKQKQPKPKKEPKAAPAKSVSQQRTPSQQPKSSSGYASSSKMQSSTASYSTYDDEYDSSMGNYGKKTYKSRPRTATNNNKVLSMNGRGSEVYVIKPQDFNEAQTVTDFLKDGKAIIINMEGIELTLAQRIIDFIGGACYALDGSLQAISGNIFVAAPPDIEVSGDLREELLNESTVSPNLGAF